MAQRKGMGLLVFYILVGAIVGGMAGELIGLLFGYFMPGSMVEKFFLEAFVYTFPPATLPLVILSFTFGFTVKVNVIGLLGIGFATYYYRWY